MRRLIEHARPEHEHEAAGAAVGPFDAPHAGHARLDDPAHDVEPHRVADVDEEALAQALFDGHLGVAAGVASQKRAGDHRFVRLRARGR